MRREAIASFTKFMVAEARVSVMVFLGMMLRCQLLSAEYGGYVFSWIQGQLVLKRRKEIKKRE